MSQKTRAAGLLETIMTSGSLPGGVTFYTLLCAIIGALPDEDPNDPCGIWKELRLNSEDARKLRIMKAMEAQLECGPGAVFTRRSGRWGWIRCDGDLVVLDSDPPEPKPEEPLWEGELVICTETGEPYNIPRDMPLSRSRRIKVREVRS